MSAMSSCVYDFEWGPTIYLLPRYMISYDYDRCACTLHRVSHQNETPHKEL